MYREGARRRTHAISRPDRCQCVRAVVHQCAVRTRTHAARQYTGWAPKFRGISAPEILRRVRDTFANELWETKRSGLMSPIDWNFLIGARASFHSTTSPSSSCPLEYHPVVADVIGSLQTSRLGPQSSPTPLKSTRHSSFFSQRPP